MSFVLMVLLATGQVIYMDDPAPEFRREIRSLKIENEALRGQVSRDAALHWLEQHVKILGYSHLRQLRTVTPTQRLVFLLESYRNQSYYEQFRWQRLGNGTFTSAVTACHR